METTDKMNKDFASYELALALEKAGFDKPCIAQWAVEPDGKPMLIGSTAFVFHKANLEGRNVLAPFLWQAQKWLRSKGIDIAVWRSFSVCHGYHYQIVKDNDWEHDIVQTVKRGRNYETSLSDAIEVALQLLDNEKKE